MEVLRDPSRNLTIEDVAGDRSGEFRPLPGNLANGYDRSAFWLRVPLHRPPGTPGDWLLEIEMPYLDHVDLYIRDPAGKFTVTRMGDRRPFAERSIPYRNFLFRLTPPEGESHLHLRVQTSSTALVRGTLWTPSDFAASASREALLLGLVHGATLILMLSALVQFFVTRQRAYALYAAYAAGIEVTFGGINGLLGQFLFPDLPALADGAVGFSSCLLAGVGAWLGSELLYLPKRLPWLNRLHMVVGVLCALSALSVFVDAYSVVGGAVHLVILYLCVTQMAAAVLGALRGDREALPYLMAWTLQLCSIAALVLRNLGVAALAPIPDVVPQALIALHMVTLSIGLGQRVVAIDRDKRNAQAALLAESRRVERELEHRVAERTAELSAEVAERQAAEVRLRESEAHLRALLDAAPFPMLVTRMPEGTVLFVNDPANALLGLAPGAGLGMSSRAFYTLRPQFISRLQTEGVLIGEEVIARRADGTQCWALISAVRFHFRAEDAVMVCLNDITARKDLELRQHEAREQLEHALAVQQLAMREQRNFLAMVSHEFRTPLSIIGAAGDVLELSLGEEDARGELSKIRRAVRRLTGLIDRCLSDEWLESTMEGVRLSTIDLSELLADLCEERAPITQQRLVFAGPPPNGVAHGADIEGDASLLAVLFANLLDNAIKYSPPEGEVRITLEKDDQRVAVTVADDGPGIAPDDAARVFEKFYRGDRTSDRSGAGLGLHLVKRIVERHHGEIVLRGDAGHGAVFQVILPRRYQI